MENELVQYYIINKDLNMSSGKIAAQVAHVAVNIAVAELTLFIDNFLLWKNKYNQKKIILSAHEKDLIKLKEQGFYFINDIGLTEIEPNSLTCVGLGTMLKSEAQKYVKRLQLL